MFAQDDKQCDDFRQPPRSQIPAPRHRQHLIEQPEAHNRSKHSKNFQEKTKIMILIIHLYIFIKMHHI